MPIHIVFVCLGNICRSPAAQGIMEQRLLETGLSTQVSVDSCGTAAFNIGKSPDPRSIAASARAGYQIAHQIARQIDDEDYRKADYLIAMDRANLSQIEAWAPKDFAGQIALFKSFAPNGGHSQIADPFYDDNAFDQTIEELEVAADGLLAHLRTQHSL
ncbi:low molecular weight phosphotyrosine protein phosphatase [Spongiibacter sp. KMU-158]|uniref:protein-tyrosine-phosphatase n=1 Tax=Spongiibacter pelagi TaxID=2760804 RepID=A0A927C5F1_9GAMM|nr:low molecular weight protein-tyrosine-phosphatase [Spongiibacter pelagi]MBD2859901.1 low molecular weight phosphotyrosine protein phosphatase [Spongiibacter pelagi]